MKNFAAIGVGGYIAPRHLEAIKTNKCNLVAGYDLNDSVGILDRHFQDVPFFNTFEEFCYFVDNYKLKNKLDYISIFSPNYMHKYHIAYALKSGADVICEKPLVLNIEDIKELYEIERMTGKKIYTVLQLRVHKEIIKFREKIKNGPQDKKYEVELIYITSRGPWYEKSWKGDPRLSGGLPTNIGIHFFDMLSWVFGKKKSQEVHVSSCDTCAGYIEYENANVKWLLSIDKGLLPESAKNKGATTFRSISYDNEELEFSEGFTDLHNVVYRDILDGSGYGLADAAEAIELVNEMKKLPILGINSNSISLIK